MSAIKLLHYAWKTRPLSIVVAGAGVIATLLGVYWIGFPQELTDLWQNGLEFSISVMTLAVALAVWYSELREEYRNGLPKHMSVSFTYKDEVIMLCRHAVVSSESDMRALSQQIGFQMAGNQNLVMSPTLRMSRQILETDDNAQPFMHYEVTIVLRQLPEALAQSYTRSVRVWEPPFTNNPVDVPRQGYTP